MKVELYTFDNKFICDIEIAAKFGLFPKLLQIPIPVGPTRFFLHDEGIKYKDITNATEFVITDVPYEKLRNV